MLLVFTLAQYSVNVERPCLMETVTFTCTGSGDTMRWELSDVTPINVRSPGNINLPLIPHPGYTVTLTAFNDSSLTTTLSRVADDGITVVCKAVATIIGYTTISLAGTFL